MYSLHHTDPNYAGFAQERASRGVAMLVITTLSALAWGAVIGLLMAVQALAQ
jgi:fermentation-respiration switch protein FrsA (DUF1100 family)